MEDKATKRDPKQIQAAEAGWDEIGATLAATVVEGGKTCSWVWALIKPLGLYKRWMIGYWIEKYREENEERLQEMKKNKKSRKEGLRLALVLDEQED